MGDLEHLREEAASLRQALADAKKDADARVDALKRQQAEAKAKAKAIILRQRQEANDRVERLEEEKRVHVEELVVVKDVLREEREQVAQLKSRAEEMSVLVDSGKKDLGRLVQEKCAMEEKAHAMERQVKEAREMAFTEKDALDRRVADMQKELKMEREKREQDAPEKMQLANGEVVTATSQIEALKLELDTAQKQISLLESACLKLEGEKEDLKRAAEAERETANLQRPIDGTSSKRDSSQDAKDAGGAEKAAQVDRKEYEQQKIEISRLREVVTALESELESAKAAQSSTDELKEAVNKLSSAEQELQAMQEKHKKVIEESNERQQASEKKLANADQEMTRLKSDLEKSERSLQQARNNLFEERQKASQVGSTADDSKKVLEAKVGELERIIASKQADIVRVRDKAKSYLRDINAEKREMEERMKREAESLRSQLTEEEQKLKDAEQRAESASSELDNCLSLIREKQKSLQMLRMTITTEKRAAEEALREKEALRSEFTAYKERARIALQERETSADASEAAIDSATSSLRAEVEDLRNDNVLLRKQIAALKESGSEMQKLIDRAQKAEAAVDLLRKDATGVSTTTYRQIDALEEKIASLQMELTGARASTEDAEARQETTTMRLEAAERALRGAEVRAEETARLSAKTIEALNKKIEALKNALNRAELSAAAAQRTAAAAAKALAPPPLREDETPSISGSPMRDTILSPQRIVSTSDERSPSGSPNLREGNTPRSSLAAAMEGHAGIYVIDSDEGTTNINLEARDMQIAVLTSQLAELGALFEDSQQEKALKSEQTDLLKAEVKNLDAKLAAAEKLQNGAPFSYLRTIVVRYLETDDPTLLPVIANVLSFSKEEESRIKNRRGSTVSSSNLSPNSQKSGYFSLPFLGSR